MFSYTHKVIEDEGEEVHHFSVQYESDVVFLTFAMEDLEAMFNKELSRRNESNGYAYLDYEDGLEAAFFRVVKSGSGGGGDMSITIDLSNPDTKASFETVIKKWEEISDKHVCELV